VNPYVRQVRPLSDSRLELVFENDEVREIDLSSYLSRGVFARLREGSLFRAARVVAGSVEWPGGIDLGYDTLYLESRPVTAERQTSSPRRE
jgi:hypothetical protein